MKAAVPVDLLHVEERILGPFDLRQTAALAGVGILALAALLGRLSHWAAMPGAALLLGYALVDLDGVPLRRQGPTICRCAWRRLRPLRTDGDPDPFLQYGPATPPDPG